MQSFNIFYPKLNNSETLEQEKAYIFLSRLLTLTINADYRTLVDLN